MKETKSGRARKLKPVPPTQTTFYGDLFLKRIMAAFDVVSETTALPPRVKEALAAAILQACEKLYSRRRMEADGAEAAAALRQPSPSQSAPFERYEQALRAALDIQKQYPAILPKFDGLETIHKEVVRQLEFWRQAPNIPNADSWPECVREIRDCFRRLTNLKPMATGGVYESSRPNWFQTFMLALQTDVLGKYGHVAPSEQAFFAGVARALYPPSESANGPKLQNPA